jgi:pyruvate/2-oxoglutarate dehydrogenase complex dihydrolipoamide dehydrogenase (E3) component
MDGNRVRWSLLVRWPRMCVNAGCIPTKTMVASAYAAHMVRRAADFGVVDNGAASVDMKRVKSRKDAISGESRTGVEQWLRGMANCTVYQGHGRFESSKEVSVGSERLAADRIWAAAPSRKELIPTMLGELQPLSADKVRK